MLLWNYYSSLIPHKYYHNMIALMELITRKVSDSGLLLSYDLDITTYTD